MSYPTPFKVVTVCCPHPNDPQLYVKDWEKAIQVAIDELRGLGYRQIQITATQGIIFLLGVHGTEVIDNEAG